MGNNSTKDINTVSQTVCICKIKDTNTKRKLYLFGYLKTPEVCPEQDNHECVCILSTVIYTVECRSKKHECVCDTGNENCKATIHYCVCKIKGMSTACRSGVHFCVCNMYSIDVCKKNHTKCVCNKYDINNCNAMFHECICDFRKRLPECKCNHSPVIYGGDGCSGTDSLYWNIGLRPPIEAP